MPRSVTMVGEMRARLRIQQGMLQQRGAGGYEIYLLEEQGAAERRGA